MKLVRVNLIVILLKRISSSFYRGEVTAEVNQVTMKMQIKQMIQNNPPPELTGKWHCVFFLFVFFNILIFVEN